MSSSECSGNIFNDDFSPSFREAQGVWPQRLGHKEFTSKACSQEPPTVCLLQSSFSQPSAGSHGDSASLLLRLWISLARWLALWIHLSEGSEMSWFSFCGDETGHCSACWTINWKWLFKTMIITSSSDLVIKILSWIQTIVWMLRPHSTGSKNNNCYYYCYIIILDSQAWRLS